MKRDVFGLILGTLRMTCLLAAAILPVCSQASEPAPQPPNIVVILADDLGYGDLGCYGATKVRTPNLDKLAAEGLRFTDGYAPSATCTPTRYALLTGEYAWRRKGTGILPGSAPLIIEPGRPTLPAVLQEAGYTTGVVGKWHLGLGRGDLDWNGEIRPGPLEIGFDYAFLVPATGDRVPCVYVENHRVVGLDPNDPIRVSYGKPIGEEPTGRANPELLKVKPSHGHDCTIVNGISRIGYMTGGKAARWVDEEMADVLTAKAVTFMEKNRDKPFFLFFSAHDIHVPRAPHPRFAGKSQCGVRGDVIEQLDWCVGQIVATLDRLHLTDRTLVLFTSDNGPVVDDGYADGAVENLGAHRPAGPLRGGKYSLYEGGTRVPWIVRWPGRIEPGVSAAVVCQVDLLASLAALAGRPLPEEAGPDSFNVLPALLGQSPQGRDHLVQHGHGLALRKGPWKYIPKAPGRKGGFMKNTGIEQPVGDELYHLGKDLGERNNLASQHPAIVDEMTRFLENLREQGRSRP